GVRQIGKEMLTNTYSFCPLPTASYHVTVWDGCNDGNLAEAAEASRHPFHLLLDGLPGSLVAAPEQLRLITASPLVSTEWNIRFTFGRLRKWGDAVLVCALVPADAASERTLDGLVEERASLTRLFRAAHGIGPSEEYFPHVTVGYFANRGAARAA